MLPGRKQLREITTWRCRWLNPLAGTARGCSGSLVMKGTSHFGAVPFMPVTPMTLPTRKTGHLSAPDPFASGRQAHTFWRKRWLIENSGFREFEPRTSGL